MLDDTRPTAKLIYAVSTLFTLVLLGLYVFRRDKNIPLTYSTPFTDWGSLRELVFAAPANLTWGAVKNSESHVVRDARLVPAVPLRQRLPFRAVPEPHAHVPARAGGRGRCGLQ